MSTKICNQCKLSKDINRFSKRSSSVDGYRHTCKDCMNLKHNKRMEDPIKLNQKRYTSNKSRKKNDYLIRKEVFDKFGHKCAICGEHRYEFLAIDHIHNDGYIDRRSGSKIIQRKVKQSNYDTNKYQLLCHNCNMSKAVYKYNPLDMEREIKAQYENICGDGI